MLRLHPQLAPVKVAVLPLVRKDGQPELAREVYRDLRERMQAEYDEGGAIGRRYRRQDEIGTPWAVTIDHQSLEDRHGHAARPRQPRPGPDRDRRPRATSSSAGCARRGARPKILFGDVEPDADADAAS